MPMGLQDLHYYDLYAPLVASVDLEYSPEEAEKHVIAAVAPLGQEYQATIKARLRQSLDRLVPRTKGRRPARTRTAGRTTSTRTC